MDFGSVLLGLQHHGKYRRSTWTKQHDAVLIRLGENYDGPCLFALYRTQTKPAFKHVEYTPSSEDMLATDWVGYPDKEKKNEVVEDPRMDHKHTP